MYVTRVLKIMRGGRNSYFENNIYIGNGKEISVGTHCHINENVFMQNVCIGDYVMIAPSVIFLGRTHAHNRTDIPMVMQGVSLTKETIVEDDVWIGRNAIIMPGVIIGEGSIVGAGSVVTKNVEAWTVVAGSPARIIKRRK